MPRESFAALSNHDEKKNPSFLLYPSQQHPHSNSMLNDQESDIELRNYKPKYEAP